jgi:hypothetical protein
MGAIRGRRENEVKKMKKQMFPTPVSIITALATLALFCLFPVNTATTQEGPCPKPYIRVVSPKAGLPGDRVEIRGRRFGTEKGNVFFSPNVKAEVLEWTNTKIWVIVPQSANTGSITVSVPCGLVSNTSYFKVIE